VSTPNYAYSEPNANVFSVNEVFDVCQAVVTNAFRTDIPDQHFKEQFELNDRVTIEGENTRREGRITAMNDSQINNVYYSEDEPMRSFAYEITMDDDPDEKITKYKASELQRDRRVYSKLILKQYLRNTTSRELWVGAPWMVKEHLAKRYKISATMAEKKLRDEAAAARRKVAIANRQNGTSPPVQHAYPPHATNGHPPHMNGNRHPVPGPGPPGQATFVNNFSANAPQQYQNQVRPQQFAPHHQNMGVVPPWPANPLPPPPWIANPIASPSWAGNPGLQGPPQHPSRMQHPPPVAMFQQQQQRPHPQQQPHPHFQTSFVHKQGDVPTNFPQQQHQPPPPPKPYEPVKYPMEDLDIPMPKTHPPRPTLKFFSDDVPQGCQPPTDEQKTGIKMKSVGPLLCAWETLNVHDTVYMLDSFTFDDFVDAMCFSSDQVDCELLTEVHCSIMRQIVTSAGKLQVSLPKMTESEGSEEGGSSKESTATPEPEPPVRTTRSSLRKSGAQQIIKARTPTPEPPKELHQAAKFFEDFDWMEQCKTRNFGEGGWQAIIVAILHRLSVDPIYKDACDEILAQLVPSGVEPTMDTIATHYGQLDVNLRISALDLTLRLTVATDDFRNQLIAAAQEMTRLRKEKIDFQRKRKEL
jgi:hypothetical protein